MQTGLRLEPIGLVLRHLGIRSSLRCPRAVDDALATQAWINGRSAAFPQAADGGFDPPSLRHNLADQKSRNHREPQKHSNEYRAEEHGSPIVVFPCAHDPIVVS